MLVYLYLTLESSYFHCLNRHTQRLITFTLEFTMFSATEFKGVSYMPQCRSIFELWGCGTDYDDLERSISETVTPDQMVVCLHK